MFPLSLNCFSEFQRKIKLNREFLVTGVSTYAYER